MEARILRCRTVERLTRLSKASIYRKMQTGTFPLPLKLEAEAGETPLALPFERVVQGAHS